MTSTVLEGRCFNFFLGGTDEPRNVVKQLQPLDESLAQISPKLSASFTRPRHFYKRLHFDLVMGPRAWHERAEAAGFQVVHWENLRDLARAGRKRCWEDHVSE